MLRIQSWVERFAPHIVKTRAFKRLSRGLFVVGEPVLSLLTKVVIDMFKACRAIARMPPGVFIAGAEIFRFAAFCIVVSTAIRCRER